MFVNFLLGNDIEVVVDLDEKTKVRWLLVVVTLAEE